MRGIWIIVIGLFACASWAQTPEGSGAAQKGPTKEGQIQGQANGRQRPTKDSPLPVTIVQSADDARRTAESEQATQKFNASYLDTQERVAEASEKQAVSASAAAGIVAIEAIIASVALYYLRKTYWETRRTALASLRSAQSSQRAAAIAQEAIRADRAWLTSPRAQYSFTAQYLSEEDGSKLGPGIMITVVWENNGRTPALNTQIYKNHVVVGLSEDTPPFTPPPNNVPTHTVMGPSTIMGTKEVQVLGDEFSRFMASKAKIIAYSRVQYHDIYEKKIWRESEVTYELFRNGDRNDRDGKTRPNIEVRSAGPQNTVT